MDEGEAPKAGTAGAPCPRSEAHRAAIGGTWDDGWIDCDGTLRTEPGGPQAGREVLRCDSCGRTWWAAHR